MCHISTCGEDSTCVEAVMSLTLICACFGDLLLLVSGHTCNGDDTCVQASILLHGTVDGGGDTTCVWGMLPLVDSHTCRTRRTR